MTNGVENTTEPPKNNKTVKEDISIMLEYSPRKNKANPILDYSTL